MGEAFFCNPLNGNEGRAKYKSTGVRSCADRRVHQFTGRSRLRTIHLFRTVVAQAKPGLVYSDTRDRHRIRGFGESYQWVDRSEIPLCSRYSHFRYLNRPNIKERIVKEERERGKKKRSIKGNYLTYYDSRIKTTKNKKYRVPPQRHCGRVNRDTRKEIRVSQLIDRNTPHGRPSLTSDSTDTIVKGTQTNGNQEPLE